MSDDFEPTYDNCDEVTDQCPVEATAYGTDLSKGAAVFFGIAFLICLIIQIYFCVRARTWGFSIWLALGTVLEGMGYFARYNLAKNPWSLNNFIVNYLTLLMAPTLVAAAISVTFKSIAIWYDKKFSLLRPSLYPWVFVGTDFLSILIQLMGGGATAAATTGDAGETVQKLGEGLVIGGVSFQVANMICCAGLMLTLAHRRKKAMRNGLYSLDQQGLGSGEVLKRGNKPMSRALATEKEAKRARIFIYALGAAYVAIIIRCSYRIAETVPSIQMDVMRNEELFLVLDGGMLLLAIGLVTIIHPYIFFPFLGVRSKAIKEFEQNQSLPMTASHQQPPPPPMPHYQPQPYQQQGFQQPPHPHQQQPYQQQQTGPSYGYTN